MDRQTTEGVFVEQPSRPLLQLSAFSVGLAVLNHRGGGFRSRHRGLSESQSPTVRRRGTNYFMTLTLLRPASSLRLFSACAALCFLCSCSDSAGPSGISADFTLTSVNGSPPPGLVVATASCDETISSGSLSLTSDRAFTLTGLVQLDCTRSGGGVQTQGLTLGGSYARNGQNLTFTIPGQGSLTATFDGTTLSTTVPASPFTFPAAVSLGFTIQASP